MQAAVRGQGVVLAKTPFLRDFIEHGDLITPFDIRLPSRYGYYLIACSAVPHSEHKQAFRDWIVGQAA
jgi:LysR family glycine cleavage system transcriptional activator